MKAQDVLDLPEAEIVDSIPSDVLEANHKEEGARNRKPRSDSGKARTRKPKDKYAVLEANLVKAFGYPVMFGTLAAMQRKDVLLMADCQTLAKHGQSLPKALVDVAREHEWFYNLLNSMFSVAVGGAAIAALCVEVITLALEIAANHGVKINIPGLVFTA